MQVTCPKCRALADRTYDPPLFRRTKCSHCSYDLEEINIKEALKVAEIIEKVKEQAIEEKTRQDVKAFREAQSRYDEEWLKQHQGICTPMWCRLSQGRRSRPKDTGECREYELSI